MSTGQELVDRARVTLADADKVTWTDAELLGHLNAGIAQACAEVLDAYVKIDDIDLVAGVRQSMPAGALLLIDIARNQFGNPVAHQSQSELGRVHKNWGDIPGGPTVYYTYDKRAPLSFLVFPPGLPGNSVEAVYGAMPPPITLAGVVPISTWFETPLWAFVLAMSYAKNTTRQDLAKTAAFMTMFSTALDRWRALKDASVSKTDIQGVL
jgi:hypothetical protein